MKKTILMFATAGLLVAGMSSCQKEDMPKAAITQTVDVSLKQNESYTFVLPKNLRDDAYEITTAAQHASVSLLSVNASGDRIYQYTPALDYTGSDQVIVSNDQEREEHATHPPKPRPNGLHLGGPRKGDCQKGEEEDHYIITINFDVAAKSSTISRQ